MEGDDLPPPPPSGLAPGGNLIATGGSEEKPKVSGPKPLTPEERAKAVSFGTGKAKATGGNLGAAAGLSKEQASQILQATAQLAAGREGLVRRFHEADIDPNGPQSPEAARLSQQIADLDKRAKLGPQIRVAMLDGDRARLRALLSQAGLPQYRDWL